MGCVRRLGCLAVIVLALAAGWMLRGRIFPRRDRPAATAADSIVWEPLNDARAVRGREAVARLGRPSGPAFVTLTGGEVSSYIMSALMRQLPLSADSLEAAVIADRLHVRASVKVAELGPVASIGSLGNVLRERERVTFGGQFEIVRPGLVQFRLRELKVREFALPQRLVPAIVSRIGRGTRPDGVAPEALPLEIPRHIGDVRIGNGRVTLYRTLDR